MNPWWRRPSPEEKKSSPEKSEGAKAPKQSAAPVAAAEPASTEAESAPEPAPARSRASELLEEVITEQLGPVAKSEEASGSAEPEAPAPNEASVTEESPAEDSFPQQAEPEARADSQEETPKPRRRRRRRRRSRRRPQDGEGQEAGPEEPPKTTTAAATKGAGIALFLDADAVLPGAGKLPLDRVVAWLKRDGALHSRRAYGDWGGLGEHRDGLQASAFDLVDISGGTDQDQQSLRLAIDAMQTCFERPEIRTFAFVLAGRRLAPLLAKLKEMGRRVVVFARTADTDPLVETLSDELVDLESPALDGPADDASAPEDPAPRADVTPKRGRRPRRSRRTPAAELTAETERTEETETTPETTADAATEKATDDAPAAEPEASDSSAEDTPAAEDAEVAAPEAAPAPVPVPRNVEDAFVLVQQALSRLETLGSDVVWGSRVRQEIYRKHPDFEETEYGVVSFTELLEAAKEAGVVYLSEDTRSGGNRVSARPFPTEEAEADD